MASLLHVTMAGPHLLGALDGVELLLALPRIGQTGTHCSWQMGPEAAAVLAQQNTSLPTISTQEIGNYQHHSTSIYSIDIYIHTI